MTKLFIWVRSRLNTCCTDIFFVTDLFTRIPSRKKAKHWELLRNHAQAHIRSSHTDVFIGKGVLKICSKFTGEHSCRSVISIKLQYFDCLTIDVHLWSLTSKLKLKIWIHKLKSVPLYSLWFLTSISFLLNFDMCL